VVRGLGATLAVFVHALGCSEANPAYIVPIADDAAIPALDAPDPGPIDAAVPADTSPADRGPDAAATIPDAAPAERATPPDGRPDAPPPLDAPIDLALNPPDAVQAMGNGLRGDYFDGVALEAGDTGTLDLSRVDATINFDWGSGRPSAAVDDDWFSVRWSGRIMPLHSETYTFATLTDEGVRLWIDGKLLIDRWVNQTATTHSGTITLVANRKYDIRMEYFEAMQQAVAKLYWSSPSQPMQIVPQICLFSP
jgi:hypothetical protein